MPYVSCRVGHLVSPCQGRIDQRTLSARNAERAPAGRGARFVLGSSFHHRPPLGGGFDGDADVPS